MGTAGRWCCSSRDDLERIDAAALEVLAEVGVSIPSERARAGLAARGAAVDGARVRLRPELVRELVSLAPSRLTLGARASARWSPASARSSPPTAAAWRSTTSESAEKRATTAADVADIARVVDAMPEIDFCWPAVSAQDRPAEVRGLHELYLALANTGKHVQTVTVVEPDMARVAVAMARALCGGDEARLRAEPPISALLGTVTPLGNDAGTLEAGLEFAAAGIPIGFVTMPMGGSTTPITMAGSLVVAVAEALSAVAVVQAAVPGAPVFICFIPSVMDLKTGDFTGGAPEDTVMGAAVADVGRFYGLPTQCGVNSSGAKEPSWQSALDDTTTTLLSLAAGVDMLTGVGMVSGGRIFSYTEMALGAETIARARRLAAGLDLSALRGGAQRSSADDVAPRESGGTDRAVAGDTSAGPLERARERVTGDPGRTSPARPRAGR